MASTQKSREEHARSAAQKAADELAASRRDRGRAHDHEPAAPVSPRGGGGGILSSVQESARSAMGAVRGAFSSSSGGREGGGAATEGAKEYAADAKEGARRALAGGDAVARKGETDESAWQQGQDVRRRAAEKAREDPRRTHEPSEAEKGRAATENIYGKATGSFGEKMVMPTDVVEQKQAEAAGGGGGGGGEAAAAPTAGTGGDEREPGEDVMLRAKDADQMTGQAFNDVGVMGEEGTGMPRRR